MFSKARSLRGGLLGILVFADNGARSATIGVAGGEGNSKIDLLLVEMR